MPTSKQFLNRLRAGRASFYLADFHVHSPASPCFRGELSVDSKNADLQSVAQENVSMARLNDRAKHEAVVMQVQAVEDFYGALVKRRDAIAEQEGIRSRENWAFLGITDHNVCRNSVRLAQYAWKSERLRENRLVVLPGMELTIEFHVPTTTSAATAHLLLLFAPLTEAQHIHAAIREASGSVWDFGLDLQINDLPSFVSRIRNHAEYRAICIAAHVGSSKGVREETKKCILSHLEAEIARAEGELLIPDLPDRAKLADRLERFKAKLGNPDHISLEVLQLIGQCGFDALQTRGPRDEAYYRRLHRFREGFGRSVSIVCSDAHDISDVFLYSEPGSDETLVPYIKVANVTRKIQPETIFSQLSNRTLRFGETRTTHTIPQQASAWIEGLEIVADAQDAANFWPLAELTGSDSAKRFTVQLSRNLNCIIGGRGSGKSALIEALAFLCLPDGYDQRHNHNEDWYGRAEATLRGCRVRLCWRVLAPEYDTLSRRALFCERYFDPAHRHSRLVCRNDEDEELLAGTVQVPLVQVFRIHDIEAQANPDKLRSLFDAICGYEVYELAKRIAEMLASLEAQRTEMIEIATKINRLTEEDGPLRQYARRKREYESVNKPKIQEQYQKIDEAQSAEQIAQDADSNWADLSESLDINRKQVAVVEFFDNLSEKTLVEASVSDEQPEDDEAGWNDHPMFKPYCDAISEAASNTEGEGEEASTSRTRIVAALDSVESECSKVASSLSGARERLEAIHKDARETLAAEGVPTGSSERQSKKTAFELAAADLEKYREQRRNWNQLADARKALFEDLKTHCRRRTTIRKATAERITSSLATDLDPSVLKIEVDAQPVADVTQMKSWLVDNIQSRAQHKPKRFAQLARKVSPEEFKEILLTGISSEVSKLIVDAPSVADGKVTEEDARTIVKDNSALQLLPSELLAEDDPEFFENLPNEIKEGLCRFSEKRGTDFELMADCVLRLDEVLLDDLPVVRLNDRPGETEAMKPLERLSPGQRCSAILPILLLNGTSPLIIDQPEDNLDNRLIRQVIVNVLASIKLRRQVIVATHNPNLPVLGDAEQVVVLRAVEDEMCQMDAEGVLDDQDVVRCITEIMEGGREAFQYRQAIYQEHWSGGVDGK